MTDATIITLCGSTKFKDAINAENSRLTQEGHVVISLGLFGHTDLPDYNWDTDKTDLKAMLDRLHFQKIRMADRVHVVNVGGYYGESTTREIAYARSLGKTVTFMEPAPVVPEQPQLPTGPGYFLLNGDPSRGVWEFNGAHWVNPEGYKPTAQPYPLDAFTRLVPAGSEREAALKLMGAKFEALADRAMTAEPRETLPLSGMSSERLSGFEEGKSVVGEAIREIVKSFALVPEAEGK